MTLEYVVVVQCQKAHNRCSGFQCANTFYNRADHFKEYDDKVKYLSFTCGGCNGKSINAKIYNLAKRAMKKAGLEKDGFTVHFASCITNDNIHSERCVFLEQMKRIVLKAGFTNIKYGSYISQSAQKKRDEGIYKTYS